MERIREVIVVEGRYDVAKVKAAVQATVLETNGFGIFKDREKQALLRTLAETRGLLVLTDSDGAGLVIRNRLQGSIPPDRIKHAYIPEILGKERRKSTPSKEGTLGVEGMDTAVILQALRRAGATFEGEDTIIPNCARPLTKSDLYADGLIGGDRSAEKRQQLQTLLGLPRHLSANRLLEILNLAYTEEDYRQALNQISKQPECSDSERSVHT